MKLSVKTGIVWNFSTSAAMACNVLITHWCVTAKWTVLVDQMKLFLYVSNGLVLSTHGPAMITYSVCPSTKCAMATRIVKMDQMRL